MIILIEDLDKHKHIEAGELIINKYIYFLMVEKRENWIKLRWKTQG